MSLMHNASGILNRENISKKKGKRNFSLSNSISIFSYLMHTAIASHGIS